MRFDHLSRVLPPFFYLKGHNNLYSYKLIHVISILMEDFQPLLLVHLLFQYQQPSSQPFPLYFKSNYASSSSMSISSLDFSLCGGNVFFLLFFRMWTLNKLTRTNDHVFFLSFGWRIFINVMVIILVKIIMINIIIMIFVHMMNIIIPLILNKEEGKQTNLSKRKGIRK